MEAQFVFWVMDPIQGLVPLVQLGNHLTVIKLF